MENYRYFLLFIFYLMVGSAWYLLTIISIWDHHIYVSLLTTLQKQKQQQLAFLLVLDLSLTGVLVLFNAWHWYLACSGMTSIEFLKKFQLMHDNLYDFSFDTVNDNLFVIFGTHKWFRILSPSLRALPLTGLEFSF